MLQFQLVTKWAEKGDEAWVGGGGNAGTKDAIDILQWLLILTDNLDVA